MCLCGLQNSVCVAGHVLMKEYELFVGTYISGGKAESVPAWGRGKEHLLMEKAVIYHHQLPIFSVLVRGRQVLWPSCNQPVQEYFSLEVSIIIRHSLLSSSNSCLPPGTLKELEVS